MISVTRDHKTNSIVISGEARRAIAEGVRRGDPVANLEYLGMTLRTINILENSEYSILELEALVSRRRDELLAIPNVTPSVMREILLALARYHQLDDAQRRSPPMF
jgi:DNA-directed RNA polymerase alpha subunit